ncbi:MAG: hypothetical protein JSR99_11770 [Proteobacteria bacterium]|nr:hypothetical protein [Pseudomonadota bacterium]
MPTTVFAGDPYDLAPLIGENVELLLGSAAVLDTKLSELDAKKANTDWLQHMADRSHLQGLYYCFIRWSCTSAGTADRAAIGKVLEFPRASPETSSNLRATGGKVR